MDRIVLFCYARSWLFPVVCTSGSLCALTVILHGGCYLTCLLLSSRETDTRIDAKCGIAQVRVIRDRQRLIVGIPGKRELVLQAISVEVVSSK